MTGRLHLRITTPLSVLVDERDVQSVRAEDDSGSFGLLPGHVDFLTALPASVLRWRDGAGRARYCALRAGVMTVSDGAEVSVSCREGVLGDDPDELVARVARLRAEEQETERKARVEHARLHSRAVRQIMRYLRPEQPGAFDHPPRFATDGEGDADG